MLALTKLEEKLASKLVVAPLLGIDVLLRTSSKLAACNIIMWNSCYPKGPCIRCLHPLSSSSGVVGPNAPSKGFILLVGLGNSCGQQMLSLHTFMSVNSSRLTLCCKADSSWPVIPA